MSQSSHATALHGAPQTARAPLSILRTETVLARFPIHQLSTGQDVPIRLTQTNAQGDLALRWAVTYNAYYGPPRHLAYKLDTIVIQQILDALPRPLPRELKLGSLRHIGTMLDFPVSGRQHAHLKRAFHQNASAYIVAYLRYRDRDGRTRTLNTGFTRYSVIVTGETLPDGTTADAIYLLLSEPYLEVLNHAPVRPLDYAYLKMLTPMAQRFYELVSYKMFAVLKYRRPYATLRYAEYCLLATQQRYTDYDQVKKQMYKIHQPHLHAGYVMQVQSTATTDADGQPDWLLHYTPGAKARAEYAAFMRQPGAEAAAALVAPTEADPEDRVATLPHTLLCATPALRPAATRVSATATDAPAQAPQHAPRPVAIRRPRALASGLTAEAGPGAPLADSPQAAAHALVTAFYQRFHGLAQLALSRRELEQATQLLAQYGAAKAHFLLAFSHEAAGETHYQPQTLGGILHYLPRALAAYDTRATQTTTSQAAADARQWEERYVQWRQEALAQRRAALPPDELAALEAESRARLVAEGTRAFALGLAVRVAVDAALEARAGLPSFADWRQTQEACG